MVIGIPKEIKAEETRVAITPSGVAALVAHGHRIVIETQAGAGSSIPDEQYAAAGAHIQGSAQEVWAQADLILKVKEPLAAEYPLLRVWPYPVYLPPSRRSRTAHPGTAGPAGDRARL